MLEHRVSRNQIDDMHFDFLLEDKIDCRTWRLEAIPKLEGPSIFVKDSSPHKLKWLDVEQSYISGGRGWVKRVEGGIFLGDLPRDPQERILIELRSQTIFGNFELVKNTCRLYL
ncbi:hypothetical protein EV05_1007 [Prochlorococcus sp. MIT 0601]|nr:hypothetical protein EV05_1007 [Prochlorococcus sp. MIT 0601]